MTGVETIARIRFEHFQNRKGIKRIARELGVARDTVRKVLDTWLRVQPAHRPPSLKSSAVASTTMKRGTMREFRPASTRRPCSS